MLATDLNRLGRLNLFLARIAIVLAALFLLSTARAQSTSSNSGGRPVESKTGTAGVSTYARDKIENVNLVNGDFSMSIPLATVGGRGSAAFTIALSYNSKIWSAEHHVELVPLSWRDQGVTPDRVDHYSAVFDDPIAHNPDTLYFGGGWSILKGPTMKSQIVYIDPVTCPDPAPGQPVLEDEQCYKYALTKMWLILPDGSEVEMRDSLTDGAPYLLPTSTAKLDRDRGNVWHSTDGSNITLVFSNSAGMWVFFPDGSRYHTANGRTTVYDRDGNYLTIDYDQPSAGAVTYTDQLGRQTILQPLSSGGASVTSKGYNGSPDRTVTVETGGITQKDSSGVEDNLRADFRDTSLYPRPFTSGDALRSPSQGYQAHTLTTPHTDLFDGSEGGFNVDTSGGGVTRVNLLDGRSIRFRYNPYNEVAEVVYPGGGVSRIDYDGFPTVVCEAATPFSDRLNRKVIRRQTLTDGVTPDATWKYNDPDGTTIKVLSGDGGSASQLLLSETHYFMEINAEYRTCVANGQSNGTTYEKWDNAKEYRVDRQTGTGTQTTVRHWEQRAPVVWGNDPNSYAAKHGQEQPANDPRVTWEETTLENKRKKRVEYGYDDFNNVTSIKEYDFGDTNGSTGALLRQTFRRYVGDAAPPDNALSYNGYCYTNLNPLDSSCGTKVTDDITTIIHQKHLLLNEEIKDGGGNREAYTEYEYDNYRDPNWNVVSPDLNAEMTMYDGARFSTFDPAHQPRGNITMARGWIEGSTYAISYTRYDNAGNVIAYKDPNGNFSTISFVDDFGDGTFPGGAVAGPNGKTFAFPTVVTNALGQQAKTQYDYTLGTTTGVRDANGVVTKTEYDLIGRPVRTTTALGLQEQAVAEMIYPTATANVAKVSKQLDVTQDGTARWLASKTEFDGFDRPVLTATAEDGQKADVANFTIFAKTIYDGLGRVRLATSPYRSQSATTDGWTRTTYDLAGRVTEVATFAGVVSSPPSDTADKTSPNFIGSVVIIYAGEQTTFIDQANKQRRNTVDGLGILKSVDEMYEYPSTSVYATTNYGYDARGNLKTVIQDQQTRSFTYDGLSRLKSATNPEVCHQQQTQCIPVPVTYDYDLNGNLKHRTDARNIVTTFNYDALNRPVSKSYQNDPNGTPPVSYFYDVYNPQSMPTGAPNFTPTNTIGRLVAVTYGTNSSAGDYYSYDAVGRSVLKIQQTGGINYQVSASYNLAGAITTETYPSSRTVTNTYDSAGRTSSVAGSLGDSTQRTYSSGITYSPLGGMSQEQLGTTTPIYNKLFYNARGQLAEIREGTQPNDTSWNRGAIINHYSNDCWGMCAGHKMTDNNGNVKMQQHWIPSDDNPQPSTYQIETQKYEYDSLNRLQRVYDGDPANPTWQQQYVLDRFGNRLIDTGKDSAGKDKTFNTGVATYAFGVDPNTNHLTAPAGFTVSYDDAGNLVTDTYSAAALKRAYDAENRMTSETNTGNIVSASYTYDAVGRRVKRNIGGVETWQVYGFDGELLAEYAANTTRENPQKEYGYRNGELLITTAANTVSWGAPPSYTGPNPLKEGNQIVLENLTELRTAVNQLRHNAGLPAYDFTVDKDPQRKVTTVKADHILQLRAALEEARSRLGLSTKNYVHPNLRTGDLIYAQDFQELRDQVNSAWNTSSSSGIDIRWLVTDQLGTPRMVFDQSGSLTVTDSNGNYVRGMIRHDYLPFGEELFASVNGRTTTIGYTGRDGERQKFTGQERDDETGLDLFGARYYSSSQGRFTSVDPLGASAKAANPQTWNRYAYALNSPLEFVDTTGLEPEQQQEHATVVLPAPPPPPPAPPPTGMIERPDELCVERPERGRPFSFSDQLRRELNSHVSFSQQGPPAASMSGAPVPPDPDSDPGGAVRVVWSNGTSVPGFYQAPTQQAYEDLVKFKSFYLDMTKGVSTGPSISNIALGTAAGGATGQLPGAVIGGVASAGTEVSGSMQRAEDAETVRGNFAFSEMGHGVALLEHAGVPPEHAITIVRLLDPIAAQRARYEYKLGQRVAGQK